MGQLWQVEQAGKSDLSKVRAKARYEIIAGQKAKAAHRLMDWRYGFIPGGAGVAGAVGGGWTAF